MSQEVVSAASYDVEPMQPITFEELVQKKFEDIYDSITKRGLGSMKDEIKGVVGDVLEWQKEVDEYDRFKQAELNKLKGKAKMKQKKVVAKKPTVKKSVKKVTKAKPKRK